MGRGGGAGRGRGGGFGGWSEFLEILTLHPCLQILGNVLI